MADEHGFIDLGHPEALAAALAQQQKLAQLKAKYGSPLKPGMQKLLEAASGVVPPKLDAAEQEWLDQVLPHVNQMATEIANAYGVPVELVLQPTLGLEADYVFQPHPDLGGYEVVGPPPLIPRGNPR